MQNPSRGTTGARGKHRLFFRVINPALPSKANRSRERQKVWEFRNETTG